MLKVIGSIAILGSGETSPNLVSVHRKLINNLEGKVNAYMIDTPFGFQENADELVKKLKEFYKNKIADYKQPKKIIIINELDDLTEIPKGPTKKILYRKLREYYEGKN